MSVSSSVLRAAPSPFPPPWWGRERVGEARSSYPPPRPSPTRGEGEKEPASPTRGEGEKETASPTREEGEKGPALPHKGGGRKRTSFPPQGGGRKRTSPPPQGGRETNHLRRSRAA